MKTADPVEVHFPGLSQIEAGRAAEELASQINRSLLEEGLEGVASRRRTDESAMDAGSILQLVIAGPATVAVAHGIAFGIQKYMGRSNRATIKLKFADGGEAEITNADSRDLAKIVSALEPAR